jgi:hypothetical protein
VPAEITTHLSLLWLVREFPLAFFQKGSKIPLLE